MSDALTIAGHALREAVRRRVLLVVALLTASSSGCTPGRVRGLRPLERRAAGHPARRPGADRGTLLGLAIFVTLFLGVVLAVFLTLDAVRGDAERGLLQPLVVRPVGRTTLLAGRLLAAAAVCATYVVAVFLPRCYHPAAGDFTPRDRVPAAGLALGVVTVVAVSPARLDAAVDHRQRHRGLHGLRRRARRGAAGPDRRGARRRTR